ncbi:protein arginine N-methyltransferase 5, partial [Clonorchis sinensis]
FAFIATHLFHPKSNVFSHPSIPDFSSIPSTRSDLVFQKDGKSIVRSIVGKVSANIDVDSTDSVIQASSELALQKELSWAVHLGLPAISLQLTRPNNIRLARLLTNFIRTEYNPVKLWITLPMWIEKNELPESTANDGDTPPSSKQSRSTVDDTPWHWWMGLSTLASDISDALGVVLEVPSNLPDESVIARWLSEPVVCLRLRTDLFLTNSKGFPVLPRSHQHLLRRFFKLNVQLLLVGACRHDQGFVCYQKYLMWLWKNQGEPDIYEQQSKGFEDQLQEPLQPLRDNLSSTTYSIFEMDPYKYDAYEKAIYLALVHRARKTSESALPNGPTPEVVGDKPTSVCQVIMVLGAGRGPLVNAALNASEKAACPVRIYVVEKNPNALFTLQDRMTHEWRGLDVHLVSGDMRQLNMPEKADIFVSELLGSFGDNELSPECLDGAQPYLKADGISIPSSYTSYVAPLQSLQFHNETKRSRDPTSCSRINSAHDTPFVVRLTNCQILSEPQPVFTFVHPKPDPRESNSRFATCTFLMEHDAVVHGLAGYFEATLFGDVTLSTHPRRHSPQMVSWFPFVFPVDHPIFVHSGERLTVSMWRAVSSRHVWYEWAFTEPRPTRIFNSAGHANKISL